MKKRYYKVVFEGTVEGEVGGVVTFRKKFDAHPLVQVSGIKLNF